MLEKIFLKIIIINKMADGRICMSVLEGSFAGLQGVGIPLPVCIHLQDLGLQLEGAQWTAKPSNTGFSISFFCPFQDCSTVSANLPCKKRRKRRKRVRRTFGWASRSMGRVQGLDNVDDRRKTRTPIDAHCPTSDGSPSILSQGHAAVTQNQYKVTTDNSKSIPSATSARGFSKPTSGTNNVDLTTCSEVQFESRDGVPGVCYQDTENTAGWTSAIGRHRKRPQLPSYALCRFPPDNPLRRNQSNHSSESDSETDEEICIPQNANVCFNIIDGVPSLQVTTKNSSQWTPVAS